MGKVLKAIGIGVLLIGAALIAGPAGISIAGATITQGAILAAGIASTLGGLASLAFTPKMPQSQIARLNLSLDPSTPRKAVFGTTAMNTDIRYHETSGSNQEYVDYIIATSAHKVSAISQIWFDESKAWDSSTGVTAKYSGYLTINVRTEGTSANTIAINGGYKWGSTRRLTGCSYVHIRIKRTGNTDKVESPLVSGIPSRVTIIGNGAMLYDPRKDSTVAGGSGSHRTSDQTTWGSYTNADDCDNPALQLLWWLLGWKINGKLSIGCGVPASRIDLPSFITAANICDENVTLAIGGTQKRYRTSGTASDADSRMDVINTFLTSMNGTLRDSGGKLKLTVMKNDLADYVLTFTEDDVLGEFKWDQTRGLDQTFNIARGRYVDPSDNSLYQLTEYPQVSLTSIDGIERVMTVDLAFVEDGRRAQRIAKQVLQRNQYRGMFSAVFTAKAMGCQVGDVVRLTFTPLGWTNKLFRVVSQEIGFDGRVPLAFVEENSAIYAWDAEDSAPIEPTDPTVYDPLNNPFILGINDASQTANWSGIIDDDGGKAIVEAGADAANNGLNSDGTVKDDKVTTGSIVDYSITAALLDGSIVHEIQYGSATNVTATDAGAVLVSVTGVSAKPSQGGKVILMVTADCEATTSSAKNYHVAWAILQRKLSSGSTWTQVGDSWRLFYLGKITTFSGYDFETYDASIPGYKVPVSGSYALLGFKTQSATSGHTMGTAAANQWIDAPPSDNDYDYRVLLCSTSIPGTATLPEVGFAIAKTAEMQAVSVKVTG